MCVSIVCASVMDQSEVGKQTTYLVWQGPSILAGQCSLNFLLNHLGHPVCTFPLKFQNCKGAKQIGL